MRQLGPGFEDRHIADDRIRPSGRREIPGHQVHEGGQPVPVTQQHHDVYEKPGEPGRSPGEPDRSALDQLDLRDGRPPTDGRHRALVAVVERVRRTPADHTTTPALRNSPPPSTTPSGRTSATEVFSRSSTPRSRSALAANSRSDGWNGPSTLSDISTSTMWVRRGS